MRESPCAGLSSLSDARCRRRATVHPRPLLEGALAASRADVPVLREPTCELVNLRPRLSCNARLHDAQSVCIGCGFSRPYGLSRGATLQQARCMAGPRCGVLRSRRYRRGHDRQSPPVVGPPRPVPIPSSCADRACRHHRQRGGFTRPRRQERTVRRSVAGALAPVRLRGSRISQP